MSTTTLVRQAAKRTETSAVRLSPSESERLGGRVSEGGGGQSSARTPYRKSESLSMIQRRHEISVSLHDKRRHILAVAGSVESSLQWSRGFRDSLAPSLGAPVELFVSGSAEALIARFNGLLARADMASARVPLESSTLQRVVLVPDIRMLACSEGLLFTRLVASFPGAGVRLLMVADKSALAASDRVLDTLARSLDIVELDAPDSASGAVALKSAGRVPQRATSPLPASLQPNSALGLPESTETRHSVSESRTGRRFEAVDFSREPEILPPTTGRSAGWRRAIGWAAAFMSLLLVSALVVVLLHRDTTPGGKPRQDESVRALSAPLNARDSSVAGRGR